MMAMVMVDAKPKPIFGWWARRRRGIRINIHQHYYHGYGKGKGRPGRAPRPKPWYKSLGCYKDTGNRAISGSIEKFPADQAVKACASKARAFGYTHFAVQAHVECFTSKSAGKTFWRYGRNTGCSKGSGGHWRMNVYKLNGNPHAYTVTGKNDCWGKCHKTGPCVKGCGSGGSCCRRNWLGCPAEMRTIAPHNHHSCMKFKYTVAPIVKPVPLKPIPRTTTWTTKVIPGKMVWKTVPGKVYRFKPVGDEDHVEEPQQSDEDDEPQQSDEDEEPQESDEDEEPQESDEDEESEQLEDDDDMEYLNDSKEDSE